MDEQLVALYHRHVATAFDRNLRLAEFVAQKAGKVKWKYEVATATLVCGPKLKFEAPLLGSHAHANDSWLWAWANRNLKLTLTNRALSSVIRTTATRLNVPMLAHSGFPLEPLFGPEIAKRAADAIGVILARELDFDAYHIESEDKYDSAILVRDPKLKFTEKYPLNRVLTVFPQIVKELPLLDHRAALTNFAQDFGLAVTSESGTLTITDGKGTLTATFNDHDELKKLEEENVAGPNKKATKPTSKKAPAKKPPAKKPPAKKR